MEPELEAFSHIATRRFFISEVAYECMTICLGFDPSKLTFSHFSIPLNIPPNSATL